MTIDTVRRLNQLNHDFYAQIANEFDETRQAYWPGWEEVVPELRELANNGAVNVLDIGCGNGRFGEFLAERLGSASIKYTGTDFSSTLLEKAEAKLSSKRVKATFIPQDIVELALTEQLPTVFGSNSYNVVSLLGVMHHIPSAELRLSLLNQALNLLEPKGLLVFATWQFMEFDRLSKKRVEPTKVGFKETNLEPNDYFLDWERGQVAYRYCHYFDEAEHHQIINELQPMAELLKTFRADGKEGNVNQYFVFRKQAS